ncbi:nicotinamidase/pyrazinamidase [Balneicella halophila]|uniref:nicotinamidase n=1 Tax=Balneicella halophila TaxID=1537566 RepID=A0A7L4UNU3_BALHA|nr:isochorismatase family cysteine hydrolase [Balneicella halophila]PVX50860.1 nicotinamidase/pyrazinamidase [Balneicella halophila]
MKKIVGFMILIATIAGLNSCVSKKKTTDVLFVNVDTQIDFMKANGKLYVENAEEIEPTLAELTKFAKERDIKVMNTCDYHTKDSEEISDTPDFVNTFPPHCMKNTEGQKYVKATTPNNPLVFDWSKDYDITEALLGKNRNIVIRKDLFDVFAGNPHTDKIVETLNPKKVFIYGVATNVCVDFAVVGFADRGYEVYVIEDAIKELPNIPLPYETWKEKGAKFIKFDEIENYL